ncbi:MULTISPECIES: DEAD/DEAH box helicase [Chromohalobacter]|jgi:ATP-dependent RNA helicase RhlB|uniref:ATP-dependent RNA helicase RhlB n=1 Tax=Chromohalobacter israelensis (strain ATCC BAA-138 / DSM 3043 / CIP 106854 / NCIMB 13768 / 1H11) TaxID=290398 RepID=Q1QX32_CHRI1|nr:MULTISPECIES: DEAD/DEAH box helicase [Chromohalobacter]ABE58976.1 DEAD/DEAH box helicase-like protein [Chromohalobacter salexigens DSM 3043]MDF9434839.1 ATP-dependent RNA helicase RhlB [Chromohalobacter israelensis]NQY44417.1 ATP-dependent RNA helicase RhlB [Chromohalobacter sp.]NWO57757.1 ATP-dependent RNA helicase RhlB [Chromohalobacter salexigens]PWW38245.1 ATP-dependent RNA helicase RhlB [Chromohalobacter salexigens]
MSESDKTSAPAQNRKPKRRRRKPRRSQSQWDIKQFQVPPVAGKWRFHDFDLPVPLMRAIHALGFEYCTPIQAEALAKTLLGGDVVGKAQTGTGKTAAFLISILAYFLEEKAPDGQKPGAPRALIVAPTRELALQIEKDAKALARFTSLNVASVVGGMDYQKQRDQLGRKVDVLVATPGRLLDFHEKRDVDLTQTEVLVLDEADRMLSMGFIPDVKRIVRHTPKAEERQTFLFSATFSQDILNLANQWTHDAAHVEIEVSLENAANIDQRVYLVSDSDKQRLLVNLLNQENMERVIVFGNRRDLVRNLDSELRKAGINVAMLSGDVPQNTRITTLDKFRNGEVDVLVATDVAGRGIHIDDVSHVVNYTLPEDPEDYVHRIGRTGRAGAEGVSISFVGEEDAFALPGIESYIGDKLPCQHPPDGLL